MLLILLLALVVLAISFLIGFTPRSTVVEDSSLRITSPFRTWSFPLQALTQVEPANLDKWTTVRLCAAGWPLPPNGWLWNSTNGIFRALATSRKNLYLLHFHDHAPLLVSLPSLSGLPVGMPEISSPNLSDLPKTQPVRAY